MIPDVGFLLAIGRVDRLADLHRHFAAPKESTTWLHLAWLVGGAAVLAGLLAVAHRWLSRRKGNPP
jgi:hypothetical protein